MNNDEMNEMIKKAQEMINNNQVPDNIKAMAQMFQGSKNNTQNNTINESNSEKSTPQKNQNSNDFSNIDMATLMKMQNIISTVKSSDNDDMSKLLTSLKPYMRNEKKEKIDEYINLIKMGKLAQVFKSLENNKNN